MTNAEFQAKLDYFSNELGVKQVKKDEAITWGYATIDNYSLNMKKAFIYLSTLSRYAPESSNSISELQVDFIFTQLEKLFPC